MCGWTSRSSSAASRIPFDVPYGVRLRSDVPITVQYSRMYASGGKIDSLITTIAYPVA